MTGWSIFDVEQTPRSGRTPVTDWSIFDVEQTPRPGRTPLVTVDEPEPEPVLPAASLDRPEVLAADGDTEMMRRARPRWLGHAVGVVLSVVAVVGLIVAAAVLYDEPLWLAPLGLAVVMVMVMVWFVLTWPEGCD